MCVFQLKMCCKSIEVQLQIRKTYISVFFWGQVGNCQKLTQLDNNVHRICKQANYIPDQKKKNHDSYVLEWSFTRKLLFVFFLGLNKTTNYGTENHLLGENK